ncbi:MAG: methylmalonyl Co-A mutase-associated GTPase MeaB [Actinomycetia bacterium]|nr:methylmalonyl Co-A mutase-associated GTPase MeaB [Actinomycetes bacterium]
MASPARAAVDVRTLVEHVRAGDARAVGRMISLVEQESPLMREASALLASFAGSAHVIGVTGAPGVGKSTATSALVSELRSRGARVGVLAIDPTSPFSGGALLGDRIRMQIHSTDPDVFVRSMATRGQLGGLSLATPQALRVLDAAGFDVVIVETVGVGQSEIEIAGLADTTVVLLAPGMGDGIQAAKAGILEVGDVYAVNKADRDGAREVRRDLRTMLAPSSRPPEAWKPQILLTVASAGEGIDELAAAIDSHHAWLDAHGELTRRRVRRARDEIEAIVLATLRFRLADAPGGQRLDDLADSVVARESDPYSAADVLLEAVMRQNL